MFMKVPHALRIIGIKEVQCILGLSKIQAWRLLKKIRAHLGKDRHQKITLPEFCSYKGLSEDAVCTLFGW